MMVRTFLIRRRGSNEKTEILDSVPVVAVFIFVFEVRSLARQTLKKLFWVSERSDLARILET